MHIEHGWFSKASSWNNKIRHRVHSVSFRLQKVQNRVNLNYMLFTDASYVCQTYLKHEMIKATLRINFIFVKRQQQL